MNISTLAIPGALLVLATLACWAIIDARKGKWWLKLILIVTVPTLSILSWRALDSYLGRPSPDPLPKKALLLTADIREPMKKGDKGVIYVLVVPMGKDGLKSTPLDYQAPKNEPRLHRIPYSREKHKMLNQAMKMIREGRLVVLEERKGKKPKGQQVPRQGHGVTQYETDELIIYELPPPDLPKKTQQ